MADNTVQIYSLADINTKYPSTFIDKRLVVLDIVPKKSKAFFDKKSYQFTNMGLIIITSGTCEITINQEHHTLKTGDIIILLPNHSFQIIVYSHDFCVTMLLVDQSLLIEANFHFKSNYIINIFTSRFPKVLTLNKQVVREIRAHLKKLKQHSTSSENIYSAKLILHHFSILMFEISNAYHKIATKNTVTKEKRSNEITKDFLVLMYTHFKKERNIQFYADQIHISRKHLTKTIIETLQKTPKKLLTEAVTVEAKVLLKNPKLTINTIVSELNFSDVAIFSKYFKTHTGMSPTEFKNKETERI